MLGDDLPSVEYLSSDERVRVLHEHYLKNPNGGIWDMLEHCSEEEQDQLVDLIADDLGLNKLREEGLKLAVPQIQLDPSVIRREAELASWFGRQQIAS
jgi:hypothetical protein